MRPERRSLLPPRSVRSQDGLRAWVGKKGFLGLQGEEPVFILGVLQSSRENLALAAGGKREEK